MTQNDTSSTRPSVADGYNQPSLPNTAGRRSPPSDGTFTAQELRASTSHRRGALAQIRALTTAEVRPARGYPGYFVSSDGEVFSARGPRRISAQKNNLGYMRASLRISGASFNRSVHHLVLEAFVGKRAVVRGEEQQCRHLNGDRADNRLSNLKWGSARENTADKAAHGTILARKQHGRHRDHVVRPKTRKQPQPVPAIPDDELWAQFTAGVKQSELAKRSGVTRQAIGARIARLRAAKGVSR